MSGWPTVPLGELMPTRVPSVNPARTPEEKFTLWSIPSYDAGRPEHAFGHEIGSSKKLVQNDDVLLSKIVPHIRRAWTVSVANDHRQIASSEWIIFRHDAFLSDYIRHFLLTDQFHDRFMGTVAGVGGSLLRAQPKSVAKIEIPLPPLGEQRRIVALLDRAEAIRRRAAAARQTARALIPALFTQTFGDPATLRNRFPSSSMREVIASKQLGVVRSTREQPDDGAFGYVRMNAITTDGRVVLDELRRTNASEKDIRTCELRDGDLLFNTRNSIELVGKMGIYRGGSGNIFNNNIMRIRLHESLLPEFLNSYLLSSQGRAAIESIKKGTTSVCAVYYKDLAQVQVSLPPLPLQTAFAAQARRIEAMARALDAATAKAEATASALSARLFGQIRPPA